MGRPTLITVGRRHCTQCRCWRPITDFNPYRQGGRMYLRSRCTACLNAYYRSPTRREYNRIWMEGHRRAHGVPVRTLRRKTPQAEREALMLPAAPLASWLRANKPADMSAEDWAVQLGCEGTFIRRCLKGEYEHIHIDTADRILMAAGAHLNDLYPLEESA